MISFIIIGRNIEKTVLLCYDSIVKFIEANKIISYEIIYVDSDSNDNTIDLIKEYPVNIISLTGELNAGIGRNEGAKFSKGNILYFIDGDMELIPAYYNEVFENPNKLKYPFVTGVVKNILYNSEFTQIIGEGIHGEKFDVIKYRPTVGGVFLIEREYWFNLGGIDDSYKTNEDQDFGLRMNNIGKPVQKHFSTIVNHHTISYYDFKRLYNTILSTNWLYRGVIIRKHLLKISSWNYLIRRYYNVFILLLSILFFKYYVFILFLTALSYKAIKRIRKEGFISSVIFNFFGDAYSLFAFFVFYPKKRCYKTEILKIV